MVIMAKRMFALNREAAENQVSLVVEAYQTLMATRKNLEGVAKGQTAAVWTADGKSVALASVLTSKYGSAVQWLDAIQLELIDAAQKLNLAIKETDQLDEAQRADYLKKLEKVLGPEPVEA